MQYTTTEEGIFLVTNSCIMGGNFKIIRKFKLANPIDPGEEEYWSQWEWENSIGNPGGYDGMADKSNDDGKLPTDKTNNPNNEVKRIGFSGGVNNHDKIDLSYINSIDLSLIQMSEQQANMIEDALKFIYENGGDCVIDFINSQKHGVFINTLYSGYEIADKYNEGYNDNLRFVTGLTLAIWPYKITQEKNSDEEYSGEGNINVGLFCDTIYLASELFSDPKGGWFNYEGQYKDLEFMKSEYGEVPLWAVLAHELYHYFDSIWGDGIKVEQNANNFVRYLFYNMKSK